MSTYIRKYDAKTAADIYAEYKAGKTAKSIAAERGLSVFTVIGIIGGNRPKTRYKGHPKTTGRDT